MINFEKMTNEEVRNFVYGCTFEEEVTLANNLEEATIDGFNYRQADCELRDLAALLKYYGDRLEKFCTKEIIDQICAERDKMRNTMEKFEDKEKYIRLMNAYYNISDVKPHIANIMEHRTINSIFKDAITFGNIDEFINHMERWGYTVTIEQRHASEVDQ